MVPNTLNIILLINLHFIKVGVDFGLKVLQYDPQTTINLQLWDIAGNSRKSNNRLIIMHLQIIIWLHLIN